MLCIYVCNFKIAIHSLCIPYLSLNNNKTSYYSI